jgi:hypothetical protein
MLKPVDVPTPEQIRAAEEADIPATREQAYERLRRIFKVLHGHYGNLFFSRYQTGRLIDDQKDPDYGQDEGVVNARNLWARGLRHFDGATIRMALDRAKVVHPEFPPNLGQFEALCNACKPRESYAGPAAIEMSQELRDKRLAENRRRAQEAAALARRPRAVDGLGTLKQAIAGAVAAAGGDEAETLLRLDRELSPKASHE